MTAEYTYFALFVLITAVLLLTILRIFRGAKGTIRQLNYESRRDRLQHERIAREKHFQSKALRRATRKINGRANAVGWDQSDRRARRDYHIDEAAHEVFDPVSEVRGMDIRTPWGWPGSNSRNRDLTRLRSSAPSGFGAALTAFFRPKQVVDHEVRARREMSIRALVEDRYGRVGYASKNSEIEWSRPQLPPEYLQEREKDQVLALKMSQDAADRPKKIQRIRLVANNPPGESERRRASGQ